MDAALKAFEAVDFQSTQSLDSVWQDPRYDVPSLHQKPRQEVLDKVQSMATSAETGSPLGWVFVGPAGIGKTHLLSAIRRSVLGAQAAFILVDMSDVHDFWETVLLGFIDSLLKPADATGRTQGQLIVQHIAELAGDEEGAALTEKPQTQPPFKLIRRIDAMVQRLGRTHRAQTLKHADILRALVLLNNDDMELSTLGHAWLQGYGVGENAMEVYGFNIREKRPSAVVEGLSWLISLRSPMVVAFDQLDSIVTQHHLLAAAGDLPGEHSARQLVSRTIIESISRGLMELRDVTRRALVVVSCLFETWEKLKGNALKSTTHRFEDHRMLENLPGAEVAEDLVSARLSDVYKRVDFKPIYPKWPFKPSLFASVAEGGMTPRELLRRCEQHRRKCVDEGRVTELAMFSDSEPPRAPTAAHHRQEFEELDAKLKSYRESAKAPRATSGPDKEDEIGRLLYAGCALVVAEQPLEPTVDLSVDVESGGERSHPALHARVRQVLIEGGHERERHLCIFALWKDNPIAFQTRLSAAMTASGIDRQLEFRKLLLVRNAPVPSGVKTTALMAKARAEGAELLPVSDADLRELHALRKLRDKHGGKREIFDQWLRARRPASKLALMRPVVDWLARPQTTTSSPSTAAAANGTTAEASAIVAAGAAAAKGTAATNKASRAPDPLSPTRSSPLPTPVTPPGSKELLGVAAGHQTAITQIASSQIIVRTDPGKPRPAIAAGHQDISAKLDISSIAVANDRKSRRPVIPVGHQVIGDRLADPQTLLAEDLRQHVVVLAGAGSGKTVLLRRLIEETALLGIPSIVVDGANDLSRLGEPWPERPASFTDEDAGKAARYHAQTDVIVWTPGRSNGNPLRLGLLPDFSAVAHDADDLKETIAMTASAMVGMAGRRADSKALAILGAALRLFAQQGGGDFSAFLDVLSDLPEEASLKISTAGKVATALSDSLRAAAQTNPLLHQEGEPLDPGILFGLGSARTRISVLSLVGLPGLEAPLQFVNQLAMSLFTWVKKNPCPSELPLRGLLVIDEAKDFVPSQGSTPCKESLIRLVAQGRKYGLGVVFATQAPKSIDHNVIANASTQFFGKASSPAAIDTVEEQLRARGCAKPDVARLSKGRFYMAGMGMAAPMKVAAPLCLSHHPASPPDETDVLRRAAASRARLER
jgi:hypothetical protein